MCIMYLDPAHPPFSAIQSSPYSSLLSVACMCVGTGPSTGAWDNLLWHIFLKKNDTPFIVISCQWLIRSGIL